MEKLADFKNTGSSLNFIIEESPVFLIKQPLDDLHGLNA